MKERIKTIMDSENMSSARFADSLNIGRAVISHILNGRNNPSLDVIIRILKRFPQINSDWLLTGKGSMYINEEKVIDSSQLVNTPDLFNHILVENKIKSAQIQENLPKQNIEQIAPIRAQGTVKESANEKRVKQIIVYYTDNTFEVFLSDK